MTDLAIFDHEGVRVTASRITDRRETYPVRAITSVVLTEREANRFIPALLGSISAVVAILWCIPVVNIEVAGPAGAIALVLLTVAASLRSSFRVTVTLGATIKVFAGSDRETAHSLWAAINRAIDISATAEPRSVQEPLRESAPEPSADLPPL